jgi:hypothetical protein
MAGPPELDWTASAKDRAIKIADKKILFIDRLARWGLV